MSTIAQLAGRHIARHSKASQSLVEIGFPCWRINLVRKGCEIVFGAPTLPTSAGLQLHPLARADLRAIRRRFVATPNREAQFISAFGHQSRVSHTRRGGERAFHLLRGRQPHGSHAGLQVEATERDPVDGIVGRQLRGQPQRAVSRAQPRNYVRISDKSTAARLRRALPLQLAVAMPHGSMRRSWRQGRLQNGQRLRGIASGEILVGFRHDGV